jgi:hypothetical protein
MDERALWLQVLKVGLDDARRSDAGEAWLWSDDFGMVCALAGVDPEAVRGLFYARLDAAA